MEFSAGRSSNPKKLRPRRSLSPGDKSSRRDSLLLPWDFFRKTKGGALQKSATNPQWKHTCSHWSRPDFVGRQQLESKINFANFNNNIKRVSKLPKSLTTTMPIFDGKSKNFELLENLFQTNLKNRNQFTEENKINYFTLACIVMPCRHLKTSAAQTERIWEKFWPRSVGNTKNLSQRLRRNTISIPTTSFQSGEPEVKWFSGRTPETSKRLTPKCCPSDYRAIITK